MKFYIKTFGCQMNEHDSGKIADMLERHGYLSASDMSDAGLILFNTCTVREHAHHKAISEVGRALALKKQNSGLIVGVCGCVAQAEKARLFDIYPELDLVFGPDQIANLPRLLRDVMYHTSCLLPRRNEAGGRKQEVGKVIATELIDDPNEYKWLTGIKSPHPPFIKGGQGGISRFITIMKGCNNNCSFCIVPSVRGREVSKPEDVIIKEINDLLERGVKEVTLLGQNVNSYDGAMVRWCDDCRQTKFAQLLHLIAEETGILRIRYTSPHPKNLSDDLIEEHATNPKLCRHMHLPLQAGSNSILRAMQRSYNKKQFLDKVSKLRNAVSAVDITTDIIVGFPGETEEDFRETLDVVKEASFDGMFAFKYSPRPGTKAAEMKDDVPLKEKEERLQRLLELNAEIWEEKTQTLVGTTQEVLAEGESRKQEAQNIKKPSNHRTIEPSCQLSGRTFGNKIVNFAGNSNLIGHIVRTTITRAGPNSLIAETTKI